MQASWDSLAQFWQAKFGKALSVQAALWVISVQEYPRLHALNPNPDPVVKEDLLHVAVCFLLTAQGFCQLETVDSEGWPLYSSIAEFENLSDEEQEAILAQAIVGYFADYAMVE